MDYRGHLKSGILLGIVVLDRMYNGSITDFSQLGLLNIGALTAGLALGSGLPDIDHHNSLLAQKLKPIGWIAGKCFSHRGFTHSAAFLFLLYLGLKFGEKHIWLDYISYYIYFSKGLMFGTAVHIAMDMFIGNGVKLLAPIYDGKIGILKIKSGSNGELAFHKFLLIGCLAYMILKGNLLALISTLVA